MILDDWSLMAFESAVASCDGLASYGILRVIRFSPGRVDITIGIAWVSKQTKDITIHDLKVKMRKYLSSTKSSSVT